jgi:tetratricopeptide (TPR) repeat protein
VVRRRFPVATALAGQLLVAGIGAALWHARTSDRARAVAEQRVAQGDKLLHAMLYELNDALVPGPGAARDQLESAALNYLRPLAADARLPLDQRRQLADAYDRLGVITGKPEHQQTALGLRAAGVEKPAPAAAAVPDPQSGKGANSIEQLTSRRDRAAAVFTRGKGDAGQLQQARQLLTELQRDLDGYMQKNPGNAEALPLYGSVLTQLVGLRRLGGDLEGAQQAAQQGVAHAERQLKARLDDAGWRQLGAAQRALGQVLVEQGRNDDGLAELRKALASFETVAAKNSGSEQAARDLADTHTAIAGAMTAVSDYSAAELQLTRARDAYAALAGLNPADASLRTGLIEL